MGTTTELYLLDYHRYRFEVVPALVRLLRTGEPTSWLADVLTPESRGDPGRVAALLGRLRSRRTDLLRHCGQLGEDLRSTEPASPAPAAGRPTPGTTSGSGRPVPVPGTACPSAQCPERQSCPLHVGREPWLIDTMRGVYQAAVVARCLGPSQHLGPVRTYTSTLTELGVASPDELHGLLRALWSRGTTLSHAPDHGIQGWLTPAEADELARRLDALALPRYEPTFAAMSAQLRPCPDGQGYPTEGLDRLSLSFVRTVAHLAGQRGHGVLCGVSLTA